MITFDKFRRLMTFDTESRFCIEISFAVNNSDKYDDCWMGKLFDDKIGKDVYWFGLTSDGKNAYDYLTFDEMSSAEVFDGRSIFDVWNDITIFEIDGCEPSERIEEYLSGSGPFMGGAQ